MISQETKEALLREKRELQAQKAPIIDEAGGLKNRRDVLIAKINAVNTRIAQIDGDLQL